MNLTKKSAGSLIAEKIIDLAAADNVNHVLDEITIHGVSDKDGSTDITFEWEGASRVLALDVYSFLNKSKAIVEKSGHEVLEKSSPDLIQKGDTFKCDYSFKIYEHLGNYTLACEGL